MEVLAGPEVTTLVLPARHAPHQEAREAVLEAIAAFVQ
jgi:hypothetical protein